MKYRSNINNGKILKPFLLVFIFFFFALVVGQIRGGRFPCLYDLAVLSIFFLGVYLFLWAVALLMPVTITDDFLRCYNENGSYRSIRLKDIQGAYPVKLFGLPYALVEAEGLEKPLTLPLFLVGMDFFSNRVREVAGEDNPLSILLSETT